MNVVNLVVSDWESDELGTTVYWVGVENGPFGLDENDLTDLLDISYDEMEALACGKGAIRDGYVLVFLSPKQAANFVDHLNATFAKRLSTLDTAALEEMGIS